MSLSSFVLSSEDKSSLDNSRTPTLAAPVFLQIAPLSDAICVEDLSESSTQSSQESVSNSKHKQDFNCVYRMVSPDGRREIIRQINNGSMVSECKTGKRKQWWATKHHPKQEIPQNIYLLGNGTISDLHKRYVAEFRKENETPIEYKAFINYTRELIKQGIMY